MPHIFLNKPSFNGNNQFFTQNAILQTPYSPKVLIIGTYNDGLNLDNPADFFYGRNYFWPVISNLSANNINRINQKRLYSLRGGVPNPSLAEILNLCEIFRFSFADLIQDVLIPLPNHNDQHLDRAISNGQTIDNVNSIIEYINMNNSISHVYCTTKFGGFVNINNLWNLIQEGVRDGVQFGQILTPSGMGGIPNFNGLNRSATIGRYWVWVNHPDNPYGEFQNHIGYNHFDHNWLINSGVNVNLF